MVLPRGAATPDGQTLVYTTFSAKAKSMTLFGGEL